MNVGKKTIVKILNFLKQLIPQTDFADNKLSGPHGRVEINKTMLNFKIESHRGQAPENRTDSLCIVKCELHITRAFAVTIPNKRAATIVPIIQNQVAANSTIWTDEHGAYRRLGSLGFDHDSVCHKYQFITSEGINTQSVESFITR